MTEPPEQKIVLASDVAAREIGYQLVDYVGIEMKLREWFPEGVYKEWRWETMMDLFEDDNLALLADFYFKHEPPDDIGSSNFVMYVHRDLLQSGPLGRFTLLASPAPATP